MVGQLENSFRPEVISEKKRNEIDILLRLFHYEEIIFEPLKLSTVFSAEQMNGLEDKYVVFSILGRVHKQIQNANTTSVNQL